MKKVRRKLSDMYGETTTRTVWHTIGKIGTHSSHSGFFFDEPEESLLTQFVKESANKYEQVNTEALSVRIDDIQEHDGRIIAFVTQF